MIAFVFLDPLMRYVGRSRTAVENPGVVQTKYGNLTEADLAGIRQQRELVEIFLQAISQATVQTHVQQGQIDARMADQALSQWYGSWHQQLMGRSKASPEDSAVETY